MAIAKSDPAELGAIRPESLQCSTPQVRLTRSEFAEICEFARSHFGLDLKEGKEELVTARLSKKMRQGGFNSFGEYFTAAQSDRTGRGTARAH